MEKEKFSKLYSEKTVDRIISLNPNKHQKDVFRIIYRNEENCLPLLNSDFNSSIINYYNGSFPNYDKQDKYDVKKYSISFYSTLKDINEVIKSTPSLRNKEHCLAKGKLAKEYGSATKTENDGHIHFFPYEPFDHNIKNDFDSFKVLKEEDGKND